MKLHGRNLIAGIPASEGKTTFRAVAPTGGRELEPDFYEATEAEIDRALEAAETCFDDYRGRSAEERARFLERVAKEVEALGAELIERAMGETGLPEGRDRKSVV